MKADVESAVKQLKILEKIYKVDKFLNDKLDFDLICSDSIGQEIDDLIDNFLTLLNVKKDNTLEVDNNSDEYYARDYYYDKVYHYLMYNENFTEENRNIFLDNLVKKISNENNIQKDNYSIQSIITNVICKNNSKEELANTIHDILLYVSHRDDKISQHIKEYIIENQNTFDTKEN